MNLIKGLTEEGVCLESAWMFALPLVCPQYYSLASREAGSSVRDNALKGFRD